MSRFDNDGTRYFLTTPQDCPSGRWMPQGVRHQGATTS